MAGASGFRNDSLNPLKNLATSPMPRNFWNLRKLHGMHEKVTKL